MGVWPIKSFSWWESQGVHQQTTLLSKAVARRACTLTRSCSYVMEQVGGLEKNTPIVFGSCLGSGSVLFSLLEQMRTEEGGLSPIRFSGSVHHSPVSAVGVSNQHTGTLTAISANEDLVAMALLEALTLSQDDDALLILADETWPDAFNVPRFDTYASAIVMGKDEKRTLKIRQSSLEYQSTLPEVLQGNPSAYAQHLIEWADEAKVGSSFLISPKTGGGSWEAVCV